MPRPPADVDAPVRLEGPSPRAGFPVSEHARLRDPVGGADPVSLPAVRLEGNGHGLERPLGCDDGIDAPDGVAEVVAAPGGSAPDAVVAARVAFGLSYDGTSFRGFADQPGQPTVAGAFLEALEHLSGERHRYVCAGRTDAGVHALGQVLHVDLPIDVLERRIGRRAPVPGTVEADLPELVRALTRQLEPRIVLWRARVVDGTFDARRSAVFRRYRYDLDVGWSMDPLSAHCAWWVGPGLDLAALRLACDPLLGSHDFTAFCRRPPGHEGPLTRCVTEAHWQVLGPSRWRFEIQANAFCHQMVRSIVGWQVAIGRGRHRPSELVSRLAEPDRTGSPTLAPPVGLCLVAVGYPERFGGVWSGAV